MKKPNYQFISNIVFYISISIMTIALISFIWTVFTQSNFHINLSSRGWDEFIEYYRSLIAVAGVGLAIFALWMTAERMNQTQIQIKEITENNRYLNFQNHKTEFTKHFTLDEIINLICKHASIEETFLIKTIYETFYFTDHSEFIPQLNKSAKKVLGVLFEPLISICSDEGYLQRRDQTAIEDSIGSFNDLKYSKYINVMVDKMFKIKDSRSFNAKVRFFYHIKILIKLYSFQRFDMITEDELFGAKKELVNYIELNGDLGGAKENWGIW